MCECLLHSVCVTLESLLLVMTLYHCALQPVVRSSVKFVQYATKTCRYLLFNILNSLSGEVLKTKEKGANT